MRAVLWLCGMAGWVVPLAASPLQRADVPAELGWVIHLDCDRLRATEIGQYWLSELEQPEARAKLAVFQTIFNFDLQKQLHGVTLYGAGKRAQGGVVLVYADIQTQRLVTLAKGAENYQSTTYKAHTIHHWQDEDKEKKKANKPRVYAAIHGGRVVIFGQQEPRVAQALDVLDGVTANLGASKLFAEVGGSGSQGVIQAAARELEWPEGDPSTALLRLAKAARLEVREAQGQLRAALNLEATNSDVARQILSAGQGLLALMKLQTGKPASVRMAEAIALKQEGVAVVATLAVPTTEVIELMRADTAAKAKKRAER